MKNLLEIGPYSEIGGVSIHIRRLMNLLDDGFKVEIIDESRLKFSDGKVFNLRSKNVFQYIKLIWQSDIVHIHTPINWLRFVHVFISKILFKKVIISIHSIMYTEGIKNNILLKFAINVSDEIIYVNDGIKNVLETSKGIVMPAFLPPIIEDEKNLPSELINLLNRHEDKKILVSYSYRLDWHEGVDLYGIDLLLEVARKAKANNDNFFIVVIINSIDAKNPILTQYYELIKNEKLEKNIVLIPYSISFVRLIQKSDMVIRATNTDGDALTVRESLFFNKPVIASDVVSRPEGTILFRNRDSNDLYSKIIENLYKPYSTIDKSDIDYKSFYADLISD